jgi:predicted nuclease of predicted toxin-antitoxin system
MKLLLDANISWRLIAKFKEHFDDCLHVDKIGLNIPATDIQIWSYAKANDCIIVTNDEDFLNMLTVKGFPPKVILLKTGNQHNDYIINIIINHINEIYDLYESSEYGLLEIY